MPLYKVSACITSYNNEDVIEDCLKSIIEFTKGTDLELIVSDNKSTDSTREIIKEKFPSVILLENEKNGGFGYGHNKIIPLVNSDFHFVVNPDIILKEDSISVLSEYLSKNQDTVIVTPEILNLDGTRQNLPKKNPTIRYVIVSKFPGFKRLRKEYTRETEDLSKPTEVEFSTGCFFGIRTEVFKKLGGFDDRFFMYMEDADISRRAKELGKVEYCPITSVFHAWERGNTRSMIGIRRWLMSMFRYFNKWKWKF